MALHCHCSVITVQALESAKQKVGEMAQGMKEAVAGTADEAAGKAGEVGGWLAGSHAPLFVAALGGGSQSMLPGASLCQPCLTRHQQARREAARRLPRDSTAGS